MDYELFAPLIQQLDQMTPVSALNQAWFRCRFVDELDRRRALERRWRMVFWLTRYIILSGSFVLPVIIAVGRSIFWVNVLAIALSVAVALATAMEVTLGSGRNWRLNRQGADRLADEGDKFLIAASEGDQFNLPEEFAGFQKRVNSIIQELHGEYQNYIGETVAQNMGSSNINFSNLIAINAGRAREHRTHRLEQGTDEQIRDVYDIF